MVSDAILAIATAPGRGGIGVIRISLPDRLLAGTNALAAFCQSAFELQPKPRFAHFCSLHDIDGKPLDDGILLYFPAPASFTGEHVLEFQGHGGPALLNMAVRQLLTLGGGFGLRLAKPGEFTQRAFLNGKMDLAQAEAVADLIDASSTKAAQAALGSLRGLFSKQVNSLAEELVSLRLLVEATLDFPEEEIDFLQQSDAKERLQRCHDQLVRLHQTGRNSLKLSAGLRLVLVGEPNVGKSSLLNALSGEDRAIVTPIAGTTRDAIHVDIELNGLRVTLIDTAGLRDTDDPVERLGIERTLGEIAQADLLLQLEEAGHAQFAHTAAIANSGRLAFSYDGPRLRVINKSDLLSSVPGAPCANAAAVWVSAKTGQGLEELKQRIFELAQCDPDDDFPFLARERHLLALQACLQHVVQAVIHADQGDLCLDLFAEELRLAHDNLGEITGRVLPDDLLGLIFSRFCIGK